MLGTLYLGQWAYYALIGWPTGTWDLAYTQAEKSTRPPYSVEAVERFRLAARRAEMLTPEDGRLARTYHDLGTLLWLTGRPREATLYVQRALEIFRRVDGPGTTWEGICLWRLGELRYQANRPEEGLRMLHQAEEILLRRQGDYQPVCLRVRAALALRLKDKKRAREVLKWAEYGGVQLDPLERLAVERLAN